MTTLHIENTVHDFDEWKVVFDKFERFRADNKVRSYRLARFADDGNRLIVDMEFDSLEDATAFREKLDQIRTTPQSKAQLVTTTGPLLMEIVTEQTY